MGEEKKKSCGFFKKAVITLIVLPVLAYAGWFGYAKATGNADT